MSGMQHVPVKRPPFLNCHLPDGTPLKCYWLENFLYCQRNLSFVVMVVGLYRPRAIPDISCPVSSKNSRFVMDFPTLYIFFVSVFFFPLFNTKGSIRTKFFTDFSVPNAKGGYFFLKFWKSFNVVIQVMSSNRLFTFT